MRLFKLSRKGKKLNRKTNISLFRNFTPELRKYAYEELHPKWEDISGLSWWSSLSDSLYLDSIMGHDTHLLDQVTIKAKRTKYKKILAFEQSVRAYYDIPKELDRMRDEGKFMDYFPWLMTTLNPNIQVKSKWKGRSTIYNHEIQESLYTMRHKWSSLLNI